MYVPLGLYMYPMGLICPLEAHLCPSGLNYGPCGSSTRPPLCVRALASFKPLEANICPLPVHLCPLRFFYAPWGSSACPPPIRARPGLF
jgi:hypothetical protein